MQTVSFSAHFDGRQIVPDEPLALDADAKLLVTVLPKRAPSGRNEKNSVFHSKEARDLAIAEVKAPIEAGVASAKAGRLTDGEEFFAQMNAELDEEIRAEAELAAKEGLALR